MQDLVETVKKDYAAFKEAQRLPYSMGMGGVAGRPLAGPGMPGPYNPNPYAAYAAMPPVPPSFSASQLVLLC